MPAIALRKSRLVRRTPAVAVAAFALLAAGPAPVVAANGDETYIVQVEPRPRLDR